MDIEYPHRIAQGARPGKGLHGNAITATAAAARHLVSIFDRLQDVVVLVADTF